MKVLVASVNRCRVPMPVMPLGACIVAEAAARAGHEARLFDAMFARRPSHALGRLVAEWRPDVVGLSIRNIDNNNVSAPESFVADASEAARAVRAAFGAKIVIGGPAVGVMPEALLDACKADYGVTTCGESVFPALLSGIESGNVPADLPGLVHREDGAARVNPWARCGDLPECSVPDWGRWLNLRPYLAHMAAAGVQTKRGCPYKCVYCTYALAEGREYCLCAPEAAAEAVRRAYAAGIRDVEFVDNVFNSPYEHAIVICERIARKPTGARLHTVELSPQFVDDRLLGVMRRAGFVGVGITAESASDEVLEGLGKDYRAEHVHKAAEAVRRSRLPVMWLFVLGGPGETRNTARQTLEFAAEVVRPSDVAFFNVGLRVYPGTPLEEIARREGVLTAPRDRMLEPVFYVSPSVDAEWIEAKLRKAVRENLNHLGPWTISYARIPGVERAARLLGLKPPVWKHTRSLRRALRLLRMDPA